MYNALTIVRDRPPLPMAPVASWKPEVVEGARPAIGERLRFTSGTVAQSWRHSWSFAKATVEDVQSENAIDFSVAAGPAALILPVDQVGGRVEIRERSFPRSSGQKSGRDLAFSIVAEGDEAVGHASPIKFARILTLEFDEAKLEKALDATNLRREAFVSQFMIADDGMTRLGHMLTEECTEPGAGGQLFADSLVLALAVKLSRRRRTASRALSRGGLAPWQLRRAQEYMLDHISEPIILQALADITGVSLAHFSRAFKCSTGQSPYQWLILSRIEKAKSLLLERTVPIAEISVALGFCDQAHLTRTFNKIVGATPLAWQRSRCT